MRNVFAEEITNLAEFDEKIVLLSADIGNKLFDKFKSKFPTRFYNCGVAEANTIGVAAGLAVSGLKPLAYTITPFITTRCLEQIKIDLCYHNLPVIIVGTGSGLSYASLGPTHHSFEDIAILRTLPNMKIICPADIYELKAALNIALFSTGPVYIRLGKKGEPIIHQSVPSIKSGEPLILREGKDICFLSVGTITSEVLKAAELLEKEGLSSRVVSIFGVKPLDEKILLDTFQNYDFIVTVEEHSIIGGYGSAVAEWKHRAECDSQLKTSIEKYLFRIGIPDSFLESTPDQEYARKKCGLTGEEISKTILKRVYHLNKLNK